MTTGLPPPAPSGTPPPRVNLPSHDVPGDRLPAVVTPERDSSGGYVEHDPEAAYRGNLAAGLFPAALILFLIVAFVLIAWTVIASAA